MKHLKNKKILIGILSIVGVCLVSTGIIWAKENVDNVPELKNEAVDQENTADEDKAVLYDKMLNTVDYFETIQGEFEMKLMTDESSINVQYSVDLPAKYAVETAKGDNVDIQTVTTEKENVLYNHLEKCFFEVRQIEQEDPVVDMTAEERVQEQDGEKVWYYRPDPTGFAYAKELIFPQERTFGYLYDFSLWNITGEEDINERICWRVEGILTGDYSQKLNVASYVFWIDKETGCLLKYEGYDKNSQLSEYLTSKAVKYNESISAVYQNEEVPEGYTDWMAESLKLWNETINEE